MGLPNSHGPILLTTLGAVHRPTVLRQEADVIKRFPGPRVVITGWDFRTAVEIAKACDADAVIAEACVLYLKPKDGWGSEIGEKHFLFERSDLRFVKGANSAIVEAVVKYARSHPAKTAVFFSQRDEKGVCYYINPPQEYLSHLERLPSYRREEVGIAGVTDFLGQRGVTGFREKQGKLLIPDTDESRYWVEKANALLRTFRPYSLEFADGIEPRLFVDISPEIPPEDCRFTQKDLEAVVTVLWEDGMLSDLEFARVKVHSDVCIDIFCRPKEETWKDGLLKTGFYTEDTPIIFLPGTEADIPFILRGYARMNFYAYATTEASDKLKQVGVKTPDTTLAGVMDYIITNLKDIVRQEPR